MDIRRTVLAVAMGLALVAGGTGCGDSGDGANAEPTAVPEETAPAGPVDADGDGEPDLPEGWPADLVLPERAVVTSSDTWSRTFSVSGTIDGELDPVTAELTAAVEAAGYEVYEQLDEKGNGITSTLTRAIDDEHDVRTSVVDHDDGPEGELSFNVKIEPVG